MKNKRYDLAIVLLLALILASCSSSEKATGVNGSDTAAANKDTAYVFDEVPPHASNKPEKNSEPVYSISEPSLGMTYYLVQIGAFTTKEKAEEFAAESRKKIQDKINVSYDPIINLFVVQLDTHYSSHQDAENVRNQLWEMNEFEDAWIVTEQK